MNDGCEDTKFLLRTGDQLARNGRISDAIQCYERAAERLMAADSILKAVAVSKQIVVLIDAHHPEVLSQHKHIWLRLAEGYERLGLVVEAKQARKRYGEIG